MIMHNVNNNQL